MEYSNSTMKALILEYIHSERDQKILYMSLIKDIPYENIAEKVGLTSRQIGTIVRRGRNIIFKHFPS